MFAFKYGKLNSAHLVKGSRVFFPHQNKKELERMEAW